MPSLSIRTDKELVNELDHLAAMNNTDRATEARKILAEGLRKAKLELGLRFLREGYSLGYAAQKAHIDLWDLLDYRIQSGFTQPANYKSLRLEYLQALDLQDLK